MEGYRFLIPKKGLLVRDPTDKNALPEKGAFKPWIGKEGTYWRRRVIDGSVSIGKKDQPKKKTLQKKDIRREK
jgi:hypothetical protein